MTESQGQPARRRTVERGTGPRKKAAPWKVIVPLAVVVVGAVLFMVLHESLAQKVYGATNPGGRLHGHPLAELSEFGEPSRKFKSSRSITGAGGERVTQEADVWDFQGTEVWIVDGKIDHATNRDDRIRAAEESSKPPRK